MTYIHHVPGRLRLQTSRLKGDRRAAELALGKAIAITGVSEARVSAVTGSLLITYDKQKLTPAVLWQSLCKSGIVSGPSPIEERVPVTRAWIGPPNAASDTGLGGLVAGIIVERLLERSAVALVGALI
jgi:Heavy metal associated domain 2